MTSRKPWKESNPRKAAGKPSRKLTAEQKAEARGRARKAGRTYPNLVDNMAVLREKTSHDERRTSKEDRATGRQAAARTARKRAATKRTGTGKRR